VQRDCIFKTTRDAEVQTKQAAAGRSDAVKHISADEGSKVTGECMVDGWIGSSEMTDASQISSTALKMTNAEQ